MAFFIAGCIGLLASATAQAQVRAQVQATPLDDILASVVKIEARVPASARSARTLGTERAGSGAVIDAEGLIVTIGYIVTEATDITVTTASGAQVPAELVAYDYETGLGLVRTMKTLNVKPIRLGDSDVARERTPAVIAGFGGNRCGRC
jgi:S1-C subfamily serine protease